MKGGMAVDVKTFATLLAKSLADKGIPREIAVKHAVSLVRTFDEDDLREVASYTCAEDFSELTESLAELISKKVPSAKKNLATGEIKTVPADGATVRFDVVKSEVQAPDGKTREMPVVESIAPSGQIKTKAVRLEKGEISPEHTMQFTGLNTSDISIKTNTSSEITMVNIPAVSLYTEEEQEIYVNDEDDVEEETGKVVLTKRGKAFFWSITVATSPFTILAAVLVLAVFALGILAVCALIAAFLGFVCVEAVAGSGLTLVGVIYGAIQIVSGNMAVGIYEIGIGVCCGAVALCLGILTYNFAVVVLPYALKQVIAFEGYSLRRVGPMIRRFREECNRL